MNMVDMTKIKIALLSKKPGIGYIFSSLEIEADDKIPTACVDKNGKLRYNPSFLEKLDDSSKVCVLYHEVLHVALQHFTRMNGKEPQLWNIATDIVINNYLIKEFPEAKDFAELCVSDNTYIDMAAEEVYKALLNNAQCQNIIYNKIKDLINKGFSQAEAENMPGVSKKMENEGNSKEMKEIERRFKNVMDRARTMARARGDKSLEINREIEVINEIRIDWKKYIYNYIIDLNKIDYTYEYDDEERILYDRRVNAIDNPETAPAVCFILDTSGSISDKELETFVGVIKNYSRYFKSKFYVMGCDVKPTEPVEIDKFDLKKIKKVLKGGGGTDFRKAIELAEKLNVDTIFYLTDMEGEFPTKCKKKLVWLNIGNPNKKAPVGKVVNIKI